MNKCIQLYETYLVRHGITLVGHAGAQMTSAGIPDDFCWNSFEDYCESAATLASVNVLLGICEVLYHIYYNPQGLAHLLSYLLALCIMHTLHILSSGIYRLRECA